MKQKLVGSYPIGAENVDVYLRKGWGGEFYFTPEDGRLARIKIGSAGNWTETLQVLLHEVTEFALTRNNLRFAPSPDICKDNGSYLFSMNHTEFSTAMAHVAIFMAEGVPDFQKAWRKFRNSK